MKQKHLYEHFKEKDHEGFLQDVSIIFIDKTDPSDPLKRECFRKCLTTPTHSLSMVLLYDLWCLALGHTVLGFWTGLDKDYDFGHGYGFACI